MMMEYKKLPGSCLLVVSPVGSLPLQQLLSSLPEGGSVLRGRGRVLYGVSQDGLHVVDHGRKDLLCRGDDLARGEGKDDWDKVTG